MGQKLQHYLNPLHIYCRLRDIGLNMKVAKYLTRKYEKVFRRIYKSRGTDKWRV